MTAFLVTAYLHNETVEGLDTSGPLAIALTMEKAKELVEQWADEMVRNDGMERFVDFEEIETRCYKTYKAIDELGDTNIIDIVINEVEINTLL